MKSRTNPNLKCASLKKEQLPILGGDSKKRKTTKQRSSNRNKIRVEEKKRCSRCGEDLPISAFGSNRRMYDGKSIYCNECRKIMDRERYAREKKKKSHNIK